MTWLVLAAMLAGLAWGAFVSAPLRWGFIGTVALLALLSVFHRRRLKRIKEERTEESICSFSRALPAKGHDTWVVRAAYEEISHHAGAPIRPSDEVAKFWGIDGDDLDDAILRIARRAKRSMDDVQKNPLCGRVVTVADVIAFIEHQPREPIQGITDNSGASPLRV
ncbi:MAG TPA: hypothetical protein VGD88_06955 [Opitutaceae bacterium]